jgi:hypothetical protein
MIRIDELYNNTFWPYICKHIPLTRLFFCDPPGRSDADSLVNFGDNTIESNYIFLHDQEPIHLDVHKSLFDGVVERNLDLNNSLGPTNSILITSEKDSEFVDQVCSQYLWKHYYYFYHGWAALDWYRGYDKTYLIEHPHQRKITHSFISPNRIIGGKRDHRILLMYHLLEHDLSSSLISFPQSCPVEKITAVDQSKKYLDRYPDIQIRLQSAGFPWNFPGESNHPMHSCWLSLFDENASSMCHVINETVFFGRRHHLTEKSFKPICLRMPFVMVSSHGSLAYLRSYGFQTFNDYWDESYDQEIDDFRRLEKISDLLKKFIMMSDRQRQELYEATFPIIEHNFNHFYNGGFENILWKELQNMLPDIKNHVQN